MGDMDKAESDELREFCLYILLCQIIALDLLAHTLSSLFLTTSLAPGIDNGSPLGLLFDHGCDAMVVTLGCNYIYK